MSVEVDLPGLARVWRQHDQESFLLVFQHRGGDIYDAVSAVQEALDTANLAARFQWQGDSGVAISGYPATAGPRGPVVFANIADSMEAIEGWTGVLAAELQSQGWSGRIGPEVARYPAINSDKQVALSAVMCLEGWQVGRQGRADSGWNQDRELAASLIEWAVDWTAGDHGRLFLSQGLEMFHMPVDMVTNRLLHGRLDYQQVIRSDDVQHARCVRFDTTGRVVVQLRDVDLSWQSRLEILREVVVSHADRCEYALVRHGYAPALNILGVVNLLQPRLPRAHLDTAPISYYQVLRDRDHFQVPDANGLQLLTDAHLTRATDLRDWQITPIGTGKHLVEAPDPANWFAEDQPAAETVERARQHFGDMIMWEPPPPT